MYLSRHVSVRLFMTVPTSATRLGAGHRSCILAIRSILIRLHRDGCCADVIGSNADAGVTVQVCAGYLTFRSCTSLCSLTIGIYKICYIISQRCTIAALVHDPGKPNINESLDTQPCRRRWKTRLLLLISPDTGSQVRSHQPPLWNILGRTDYENDITATS